MNPKISVIIPAANEERFIERAIRSVTVQGYARTEIIVVINGASDATLTIARSCGARTVYFKDPIGYSRARNAGAAIATGDIYVFLDADSVLGKDTLSVIARRCEEDVFGTGFGGPDTKEFSYTFFFFIKNTVHRLGLYEGVLGGMQFCHAALFQKSGGFSPGMLVDENREFRHRIKQCGGKYLLIRECVAHTSMRRWEKEGKWHLLWFWCKVKLSGWLNHFHLHRKLGTAYAFPDMPRKRNP